MADKTDRKSYKFEIRDARDTYVLDLEEPHTENPFCKITTFETESAQGVKFTIGQEEFASVTCSPKDGGVQGYNVNFPVPLEEWLAAERNGWGPIFPHP